MNGWSHRQRHLNKPNPFANTGALTLQDEGDWSNTRDRSLFKLDKFVVPLRWESPWD